MKNCYEESNQKVEHKCDFKGKEKVKGKWPPKRGRPQDAGEKENVTPYKKFSAVDKGHVSQPGEQQTRGDSRALLLC